jgi:hypothetical protein
VLNRAPDLYCMPAFSMEKLDVQLLQAAKDGDLGTVKAIVTQEGKDVLNKCMNEMGQTPLHLASRYVLSFTYYL